MSYCSSIKENILYQDLSMAVWFEGTLSVVVCYLLFELLFKVEVYFWRETKLVYIIVSEIVL